MKTYNSYKEWPKWLKITVWFFIGFFLLMFFAVWQGGNINDEEKQKITTKQNANSLDKLKGDTLINVLDAFVAEDSVLHVSVTNPEGGGDAMYFMQNYYYDNKSVKQCMVYQAKKTDANKWLKITDKSYNKWYLQELRANWEKTFISSYDGSCIPLKEYLQQNMNDASSYENVSTRYTYNQEKNLFSVFCRYRGANLYGAKVLADCYAEFDLEGKMLKFKEK